MSCEYNARSGKTSNSGSREVGVVNLQDNLLTYTSSFVKEYTCLRGDKGRFNPLTCKKTPAVEHFCYSGDIHALSSFLLISIYAYSKLSEPWEWIVYKPKKILDYSKNYTSPPLMPPPNYHIELCNTHCNHFGRVIPLGQGMCYTKQADYLFDFRPLSGINNSDIVLCDRVQL